MRKKYHPPEFEKLWVEFVEDALDSSAPLGHDIELEFDIADPGHSPEIEW